MRLGTYTWRAVLEGLRGGRHFYRLQYARCPARLVAGMLAKLPLKEEIGVGCCVAAPNEVGSLWKAVRELCSIGGIDHRQLRFRGGPGAHRGQAGWHPANLCPARRGHCRGGNGRPCRGVSRPSGCWLGACRNEGHGSAALALLPPDLHRGAKGLPARIGALPMRT
jgi:hypothetical protein